MISQVFIQSFVDGLIRFATDLLLPTMVMIFICAVAARALVYYTIKREDWFTKQYQKRVSRFVEDNLNFDGDISFYFSVKRTLENTFYELFKIRAIMKRRNPDIIMAISDRIFLIQQGCARLVKDTLTQIRYVKYGNHEAKTLDICKNVFQHNPCFNKVFGIFSAPLINDILGILPGIFIVGGIFGTFLGIMKALPELGGMDLTDIDGTKAVMDAFLMKISFSMSTSIIGIILSVSMSVINTALSPEKLFIEVVDRYDNCLTMLWNRSSNNTLKREDIEFDDNRDPIEALAEAAVNEELGKKISDETDSRKYVDPPEIEDQIDQETHPKDEKAA